MSLVVKPLFSFCIVYRQKHLSVLAVIYPSLTYIVFPLNPITAHSTATGHPCHIFNASIHQPVTEFDACFFHTSKAQLKQWRSVIVEQTRYRLLMGREKKSRTFKNASFPFTSSQNFNLSSYLFISQIAESDC